MGRVCAYCEKDKKLTKEHIWPKCILERMPELNLKFLDSKKLVINSELVISDVCSDCNNIKLSPLDNYFCLLYDQYFKHYVEEKKTFIFKYNYDLLLRSLLKITYNSSRTVTRINNDFDRFKNYILLGTEIREDIVVKLDIVTPAILNGQKLYPKSARCGVIVLNVRQENYILRVIAVNSFYFFIIISRNERITSKSAELELSHIISSIPGTIIHPYSNEIRATDFSDFDTFTIHQSHILTNKEYYHKFLKK